MINKVTLVGNVGGDPEIRHLEGGTAVGKFSLATNESYKDREGNWQTNTEWHDIVVWRSLAERAERDVRKGTMLYLEGKLTHRKWQDKDGNNRYTTEVVANFFRILNRRENENSTTEQTSTATANDSAMGGNSMGQNPVNTPSPQPVATENDDLPF